MGKILGFLKGKKSFIIAALLVLVALFKVIVGDMSLMGFLQSPELIQLLSGFGLAALRSGVSK